MIRYIFSIFLVLSTQISYAVNWKWEPRTRDDGAVVILASREGFDSLNEVIESTPKESCIKHIGLSVLSQYAQLQSELHSYMAENYPQQLEEALNSAGNMHNPKVIALHQAFREAILKSSYVQSVNEAFSKRCEKISSVSFEKFHIAKSSINPKYEAMVWLTSEKCT